MALTIRNIPWIIKSGFVYWMVLSAVMGEQGICPNSQPIYGCVCSQHPETEVSTVTCNNTDNTNIPSGLPNADVMNFFGNAQFSTLEKVDYDFVTTLRFNGNKITHIEDNAFEKAAKLENLFIENELITAFGYLTSQTFAGLGKLDYIHIANTPLHLIQSGVFGEVIPSVIDIKLDNCDIYEIEENAFSNSINLQYLGLHNNRLEHIPVFTTQGSLENLKTLNLESNRIRHLIGLSKMPKLETLLLKNNALTHIAGDAFDAIATSVLFIDLSYNFISVIETVAFISLSELDELYLNNNSLTHVVWEELPWNDKLTKIAVSQNPWRCSCLNKFLVEDETVSLYNHQPNHPDENIRCGSPEEVQGEIMYDIPATYFECDNGPPDGSSSNVTARKAVIITIAVVASIILVALGVYVFSKMAKWKRQKQQSDSYFRVTAKDGILQYADQNYSSNI